MLYINARNPHRKLKHVQTLKGDKAEKCTGHRIELIYDDFFRHLRNDVKQINPPKKKQKAGIMTIFLVVFAVISLFRPFEPVIFILLPLLWIAVKVCELCGRNIDLKQEILLKLFSK